MTWARYRAVVSLYAAEEVDKSKEEEEEEEEEEEGDGDGGSC